MGESYLAVLITIYVFVSIVIKILSIKYLFFDGVREIVELHEKYVALYNKLGNIEKLILDKSKDTMMDQIVAIYSKGLNPNADR